MEGNIKTKRWHIPNFKIQYRVFQGDTLSPLIILLAFNLLIELCNNLPSCGFSLKLPVPHSSGLPTIDTAIYIKWNEASSDEPADWYYRTLGRILFENCAFWQYQLRGVIIIMG